MKSDFSRFLHHTMSYSGLTRISRLNKFATWFDLDHRVKPDGDEIVADCGFTSECDGLWCKKRLKFDFIIKSSKKVLFNKILSPVFFCNIYESMLCISCNQ